MISLLTLFARAQEGSFTLARPELRTAPLYLQAHQLIYVTRGNRLIAQGNVEIYYNTTS